MGTVSGYPRLNVFRNLTAQIACLVIVICAMWFVSEIRVKMVLTQYQKDIEPIMKNMTESCDKNTTCPMCSTCPTSPPAIAKNGTSSSDKETCPKCPPEPKKFDYKEVECYKFANNNSTPISFLEELTESPKQPAKGNTIFFTETSCVNNGTIYLDPR